MMRRLRRVAVELWLPIVLVALWWTISASYNSLYFPSLQTIMDAFARAWVFGGIVTHLIPTLLNLWVGLMIGVALGISAGLAIGSITLLRRALFPTVEFLRAIPAVALVPLFIVIIGIGAKVSIAIVAITSFWPVLLNTVDGVRGIDKTVHDIAKSFKITRLMVLREIILPAASPQIMVGIRLAIPLSISLLVFAEMVASTRGVGFFVFSAQQSFAIADMWSGMVLLGVVGYLLTVAFRMFEGWVLWWSVERNGGGDAGSQ